jgi:AcrR family transcriptional regulator
VVAAQLRQPGNVLGPRANRTIATILDATRQIFLVRGYAGTTVDEIARAAGVSRGSFYTYFPSKRDVLLTLGASSLAAARQVVRALDEFPADWRLQDLEGWVGDYYNVLEAHGSFSFAWTQAAHEDEEIRRAGMEGHLDVCLRLGRALAALGGRARPDAMELGLASFAMLERVWTYSQLYGAALDDSRLRRTLAHTLAAAVRTS